MRAPPERIETERLLLRRWELDDADAFAELLESSRDHYGAFIAFFLEGEPLERMRRFRDGFDADESYSYAAFANGRLVGGGGLFPRVGPGALEIGYHVRADSTRRGYATEIASALAGAGFDVCGAKRLEMHIGPRNVASVAVARKLGFAGARYDEERALTIFSRVNSSSDRSTTSA